MAAPTAAMEDVELEMPDYQPNNVPPQPNLAPPPSSLPPSMNPSLNVSHADSDDRASGRTEEMSDFGADRETIGMRYACPNIGCSSPEKPVYSNPKYAGSGVPGKKRYPTLDRPPSRAPSQSTVHSNNQSTADLVNSGKKGAQPSGAMAKFKAFWKDPRYDKLRAIIVILLLVILLLLIIILPIVLRQSEEAPPPTAAPLYETVRAPLIVCDGSELEGAKKDGVSQFRGIPYALPPVHEKRWRAAQPVTADNCRKLHYTKAMMYGPECVQSSAIHEDTYESEDCLYLNIWTPSNHTNPEKLPVMVWIHGGDLQFGNGGELAQYPVEKTVLEGQFVLVSMNYRLSVFGFMALEALEDSNVGLTDQLVALQWVQQNIAGFGGDKNKVTVFGIGAGATSILALLNSNQATGLFHRAWLMSPGVVQDVPAAAAKIGNADFLRKIGCQLADAQQIKACLYEKSTAEVQAAVPWYSGPHWAQPLKYDVPIKDNTTGPYIVTDALVGGGGTFDALNAQSLVNKQIPVIIGNADADADIRPPADYFGDGATTSYLSLQQLETIKQRLEAFDPLIMGRIQSDYTSLETEQGFTRLVSDIRSVCPANQMAQLFHNMGTKVYRYIYQVKPDMRLQAFHHYNFQASHTFMGIDMLAFFGAIESETFSPYFENGQAFAEGFRREIFKFIKGEVMSWSPMPEFMKLTKTASAALPAQDASYPRNCTQWSALGMIPKYTWSN